MMDEKTRTAEDKRWREFTLGMAKIQPRLAVFWTEVAHLVIEHPDTRDAVFAHALKQFQSGMSIPQREMFIHHVHVLEDKPN